MITQRFRPVVWVVAVASAATMLYMISLQVAAERGRLEALDRKIISTRHDIRQLQTELGTRANLRQLERWNGEVLALSAPEAEQYLHDERALASFDQGVLAGKTDTPAVMFADAAALLRTTPEAAPAPEVAAPAAATTPNARPIASIMPAPVVTREAKPAQKMASNDDARVVDKDRRARLSSQDKAVQDAIAARPTVRKTAPQKVAMAERGLLDRSTLGDLSRAASGEAKAKGTSKQ